MLFNMLGMTKKKIIFEYMNVDSNGCGDQVSYEELNELLLSKGHTKITANGDSFFRDISEKEERINSDGLTVIDGIWKGYRIRKTKSGTQNLSVQLLGYDEDYQKIYNSIPSHVKSHLSGRRCISCGSSARVLPDHKDGRKRAGQGYYNSIDQFQPLCNHCNLTKREFCKKCRNTEKRFDASDLGYKIGFYSGSQRWEGSCAGCYWYDLEFFRRQL